MTHGAAWAYTVGTIPHKVTAYERVTKRGIVYLRWRERGNWRHRSLGFAVRDDRGRLVRALEQKAQHEADKHLARLTAGLPEAERPTAPLSIAEGLTLFRDPKRGAFPTETPYLKEVTTAVRYAGGVLGMDRPWLAIRGADLREVWRRKIRELHAAGRRGHRGAVVVVARTLAVAQWLRDEELVPLAACVAPRNWRQRLAADWREITGSGADYEPDRARHTIDEMRAILAASAPIDPRFHLLLMLGAELRLGQVRRVRRRDVDRAAGTVVVRGRGKKEGTIIALTARQQAVLEAALTTGYLRVLEAAGGDYPLFPAGKLHGWRTGDPAAAEVHRGRSPVVRTTIRHWFDAAEAPAGITHRPGRGYYGLRRVAVDGAVDAGISLDGLKVSGGWSDIQVPKQIYEAKQRAQHRQEAAEVRAKVRGEG